MENEEEGVKERRLKNETEELRLFVSIGFAGVMGKKMRFRRKRARGDELEALG